MSAALRIVAATAALAVSALATTSALATEPANDVTRLVRFDDLDLSRPAGASLLYRRLNTAASLVCRAYDGAEPARRLRFEACRNEALDRAVKQLDAPLVSARHRGERAPVVASMGRAR